MNKTNKDIKETYGKTKVIKFSDKDVNDFQRLNNRKALTKKGLPTKWFEKYLKSIKGKKSVNSVNKTSVKMRDFNTSELDIDVPISKQTESSLENTQFYKKISELTLIAKNPNNSQEIINSAITDIKKLLVENIKNPNLTLDFKFESDDLNTIDNLIESKEYNSGYVFFFWSNKAPVFKIIPLKIVNPIFELINVKQEFYLDQPALICNDLPIYFCFNGIPYSVDLNFQKDLIFVSEKFTELGYKPDKFYYTEKNKHYIKIMTKQGFERIWYFWISLFVICCMLSEYIILMNIYQW